MAGLVAIIAEAAHTHVSPTEVEQLASCYTALRAEPESARLSGALGTAVVFAGPGDLSAGVERGEGSWAAHVGSLHVDGRSPLTADPSELDGQFAIIRWRAESGRLEVFSDPFGLQTLYMASRNGFAYVSTSVLVLAKYLHARPSVHGLRVFLRAGHHIGELTSWEGIERFAPATCRSYRAEGNASAVYWRPEVDRRLEGMKLEAAAKHCVEAAVGLLRPRFALDTNGHPQPWCDLTGGYDSRIGTLLLDRAGVRFATNTNGSPEHPDALIAKRIAAVAGWRWDLGAFGGDCPLGCEQSLFRALAWGDGMLEVTQLAAVMALQDKRALEARMLFTGGGGEHWRDYAWKQEMPFGGRRKRVNLERWIGVRFMHPIDVSVFRDDPTSEARESLLERARARAEPYADELNAVSLDVLHAYKSMAHHGAYQSAARGTLRVELPFYAKEVFGAAFSVTPRHRNLHRFARAVVHLLNPRVAEMPTTSGDPSTPLRVRNAHRFVPLYTMRVRDAARKLTQNLPGPTLGALNDTIPTGIESARRRLLEDFIAHSALDPSRMRSGSLYDATALRRLAGSSSATTTGWATLGRIITAERALEVTDAHVE